MTDATPLPFDLPAVARKKLTVDFDGGNQSSDARRAGCCARPSRRSASSRGSPRRCPTGAIRRASAIASAEIIGARVFGICCGYEDGIDHDRLRDDPAHEDGGRPRPGDGCAARLAVDHQPVRERADENGCGASGGALVDQFTARVSPSHRDIFDIDDTFDAAHGGQQLTFWNAHHDERGFAPMHVYHAGSGFRSRRSCGRRRRRAAQKCAPSSSI